MKKLPVNSNINSINQYTIKLVFGLKISMAMECHNLATYMHFELV